MSSFLFSILASNFRRLSSPLKLSYAVTYRCNLRCAMCKIWEKNSRNELTVDDVRAFFHRPHGTHWVGLTGGEPFLRDDLPLLVDAILTSPSRISALHFATNGTLTERIVRLATDTTAQHRDLKLVFTVSIDGPPELHDKIRGRQNVWEDALHTYRLLKKIRNVKPQFGFTISHNNIARFKDTFLALKDAYPPLTFDDMTVNIFQRSSFYYDNQSMPPLAPGAVISEIRDILAMDKDRLSLNNFLRRRYLALYLVYLRTGKTPLKCQSFANTCFLDPYGNVLPCAVYNRKLTNIRESKLSINELWQLQETRQIHTDCAQGRCPSCWSPCDAYSAIGGSLIPAMIKR
jgi:Fe-coproporphyrin III synthase